MTNSIDGMIAMHSKAVVLCSAEICCDCSKPAHKLFGGVCIICLNDSEGYDQLEMAEASAESYELFDDEPVPTVEEDMEAYLHDCGRLGNEPNEHVINMILAHHDVD